jgi:hypothetical protein
LPTEILIRIGEFIPSDRDMRSPTANIMHDELTLYNIYIIAYCIDDLSFFDYFFYNYDSLYSSSDDSSDVDSDSSTS